MLNIGRKRIKKLKRGSSSIIEVYKGSDLVFQDFEAVYGYKMTIDTTKTPNNRTFVVPNDKIASNNAYDKSLYIDWGDGDNGTYSGTAISHTYAVDGTYHVMILPVELNGSKPRPGWLSGMKQMQTNSSKKVISIDTPLPKTGVVLKTYGSRYPDGFCTMDLKEMFYMYTNLASIPYNFFDNLVIDYSQNDSHTTEQFRLMFCSMGTVVDALELAYNFIGKIASSGWAFRGHNPFTQWISGSWTQRASIPDDFFSRMTFRVIGGRAQVTGLFRDAFNGLRSTSGEFTVTSNLFDIGVPIGLAYQFNGTFASSDLKEIPADLFSKVIVASDNCISTFDGTFRKTNIKSIPAGLFDTIDFSNVSGQNNSLFSETFCQVAGDENSIIPAGLFDHVFSQLGDKIRDGYQLFYRTFYEAFPTSTVATIPADIFKEVDTSRTTSFYRTFASTFASFAKSSPVATIPATLFSHLDTSSATNMQSMFQQTFQSYPDSATTGSIPAGLFSAINTQSVTDASIMFNYTFNGTFKNSTDATIPAGLLAIFDNNLARNCWQTFFGTFQAYAGASTAVEIPADLFGDIRNGYAKEMFKSTFSSCGASSTVGTIPAGLFDGVVGAADEYKFNSVFTGCFEHSPVASIPSKLFPTMAGTKFKYCFQSAFRLYGRDSNAAWSAQHPQTIPSDLFDRVDTSNATTLENAFGGVFEGMYLTSIPEGIFGGLVIPANADLTSVFHGVFRQSYEPPTQCPIKDVFLGMTDFTWATADNVGWTGTSGYSGTAALGRMFQCDYFLSGGKLPPLTGSASTVLQHFNFTPTTRTFMFESQTSLTDYATIDTNWKNG